MDRRWNGDAWAREATALPPPSQPRAPYRVGRRLGLDYYAVRQAVRRLERRGLIEPVATRRQDSRGRPELLWMRSADGADFRNLIALGEPQDLLA